MSNEEKLFRKVYARQRIPDTGFTWYDTSEGHLYFDGEEFSRSGVCLDPVDKKHLWWLEEIPVKNLSSPQEVGDGEVDKLIQWLQDEAEQLRDETKDKYKFGKCSGLLIAKIKLQALRSKLNK